MNLSLNSWLETRSIDPNLVKLRMKSEKKGSTFWSEIIDQVTLKGKLTIPKLNENGPVVLKIYVLS